MRDGERWPDDGSPGSGGGHQVLASWPDIDLAAIPPVRLLGLAGGVEPGLTGARESFGAIAACEHILRHVSALQLRFIHRAVTAGGSQEDPGSTFSVFDGVEVVAAELAPLFGLSRRSAQNKVSRAHDLVRDLPKVVDLVEAGSLDLQRASAVDDVMREVLQPEDEAWAKVHQAIAARAPGCSHRWLRELTRRAIHNADPEAAGRRHRQCSAERQVVVDPLPHAMATVTATLSADQAQLVDTVLDALADGCRDQTSAAGARDQRTHDQRRADAFVALFRSVATGTPLPVLPALPATGADDQVFFGGRFEPAAAADGPGVVGWWRPPALPKQQGRRPQITVTLPLSTLTGADEQAADLAGYGPIPAALARAIAAESENYRVVPVPDRSGRRGGATPRSAARATDRSPSPPGVRAVKSFHGPGDQAQCDAQEKAYRPTQTLADRVMAFHRQCRHPGCALRAQRCDLDHAVEYPQGTTCFCNLMPLCRFHHRLKTHGGWQARFTGSHEAHPIGTVEWTSPYGARYYDTPQVYDLGFGSPRRAGDG